MKRAVRLILVAASALAMSGAASAQDDAQIGSRLVHRRTIDVDRDHATAMRIAHEMFSCAVMHFPNAARQYLASKRTEEAAPYWKQMFGTELSCSNVSGVSDLATDTQVIPPEDVSRGLIAEALLGHISRPSLEAAPLEHVYHADWTVISGRAAAIDDMAMCVAATNPAGIMRMLGTIPETADEMGALSSLSPSLGQCLVANAKLTANREGLRAALAEALYHRIADQASAPAAAALASTTAPGK